LKGEGEIYAGVSALGLACWTFSGGGNSLRHSVVGVNDEFA
jgi:hypothetical protein